MKIAGIVFVVFGALCVIGIFIGLLTGGASPEYSDAIGKSISGGTIWIIIGGLLIHSANKRKKEKEEKDKWSKQ